MTPARRTATGLPSASAPWAWAVWGALLGLLLTLLVCAPAQWAANALQDASGGRSVFHSVRGTVWNGSAQWTLTGGPGSQDAATLPGRLQWSLRPAWGGLTLSLQADCCMRQPQLLTVQPLWGGARLRVADAPSEWPLRWLSGLGTPWNTIQADGSLQASTRSLVLTYVSGRLSVAGTLQVDAQNVSSRLSTLRPMGSYRIVVDGGDSTSLVLQTLQGGLQLKGAGQWVGGTLRFTGEATTTPELQDALANLLNIIGRREGERSLITIG